MISEELTYRVRQSMGLEPTGEQTVATEAFARFMTDTGDRAVMVMRGAAGTGKTTLAAAVVKALVALRWKIVLLAPTGRAAKVFSIYSGCKAHTIHRCIYRQKALAADMSGFRLSDNLHSDTLFIIDEASMISDSGGEFGSGRLLDDLIEYVYGGRNCRMMLIGDRAQLPPVGETESPALSSDVLSAYGLRVFEADLSEVLRQSAESGILYNATIVRQMLFAGDGMVLPLVRFAGFADIVSVPGSELIETLAGSYSAVGIDETMVVTRSNKRANIYNNGIRNMVLGCEEELSTGDMVMIVKNKYLNLSEERRVKSEEFAGAVKENVTAQPNSSFFIHHSSFKEDFIANGDRAVVRRVRNVHEQHGFRFADVTLEFPDYDNAELSTTVVLDSLASEGPALTREQNERLFNSVMADYADIPRKADRLKRMKEDKYYGAMQIKYAYAVTCHKAQGGQWAHIYVDQGYMTDDMLTPDYIHWLYTAFTRATEKLFLVNWPKAQTVSES
ncbi:MAG: AAA family ATPase [Prevotella sp.]|nr:AAA family ATPase [Prevotella sp.]